MSAKRAFDLLASALGILIISPLLAAVAVVLKFTGEGEILFLQERVGHRGKPFRIWKFASMLKDSPNIGTQTMTLRNDPRITPVGRYLRVTKINELPQLFNVLRGEMSFVGARPLPKRSFMRFSPEVRARIYSTPPGITGIGSIVFRDEEKLLTGARNRGEDPQTFYTEAIYPYKGQLELWYCDRATFATDMKILALTFWIILVPRSEMAFRVFPDLPSRPEALTRGAS